MTHKVHEWRLVTRRGWSGWAVNCSQCGARGTLLDLDNAVGCFYALRNERDELQETLEQLRADYYIETVLSGNLEAERDEARQWAICMKQERDRYLEQRNSAWKRTLIIASERDKLSMLWETKHRVEIDTIKQCRCETCQKFHSGTYTCSEWAPLRCVVNDYSEWEEKIETVTGTGRVISVAKRPDLVIEDEWEAKDG